MNIAIIGNSGSGKSWLAEKLSEKLQQPHLPLDQIFWLDDHFTKKCPSPEMQVLVETSNHPYGWIAEGVYGELILAIQEQLDMLIWLTPPWEICKLQLTQRGLTRASDKTDQLIEWASHYESRSGQFSHDYHQQIYLDFPRDKVNLSSHDEFRSFLQSIH